MGKNHYAERAGGRIRLRRKELGWTQDDLSKATGGALSASRIANYEQGTREIGIQEAEILGKALKVSPAFLMGFTPLQEYQEAITKGDESLLAIVTAWHTLSHDGRQWIENAAQFAKANYHAGADARRGPNAKGLPDVGPRNAAKPTQIRALPRKRRRRSA